MDLGNLERFDYQKWPVGLRLMQSLEKGPQQNHLHDTAEASLHAQLCVQWCEEAKQNRQYDEAGDIHSSVIRMVGAIPGDANEGSWCGHSCLTAPMTPNFVIGYPQSLLIGVLVCKVPWHLYLAELSRIPVARFTEFRVGLLGLICVGFGLLYGPRP